LKKIGKGEKKKVGLEGNEIKKKKGPRLNGLGLGCDSYIRQRKNHRFGRGN